MDVQVRVHEDFDLGGGFALTQGIHDVSREVLFNYLPEILTGNLFFPLEINQFDALNQQLNEQIYLLYKSDSDIKNSIPSVPLTTKGDILGFSTANVRIPVGSNDQVLTADSTTARGVAWKTPSTSLTIGTTPISSGANNRVLFQSGGVVSQDADLQFDSSNNRLTVGSAILQMPNSTSLFLGSAPNGSYSGIINAFFGDNAGAGNTGQYGNTYLGSGAGSGTSGDAYFNTFVGTNTGVATSGRNNTFLGYSAGNAVTSGTENTFIGAGTGGAVAAGSYNTLIGRNAGAAITGSYGVALGYSAGVSCTSGDENTFIGQLAGYQTTTGGYNTFLGSRSGSNLTTGSNNCAIGYNASLDSATASNQTNINNTFVATSTEARISGRDLKIEDGKNIILGTSSGSSLGTAFNQKTGMHGETIVQDTGWNVSGYTALRTLDASTVSHADLAKSFCTLIAYLVDKGLLGA